MQGMVTSNIATQSNSAANPIADDGQQPTGQSLYQQASQSNQPDVLLKRQFDQISKSQKTKLADEFVAAAGQDGMVKLAETPDGQHALAEVYHQASEGQQGEMEKLHDEQGETAVDYTNKNERQSPARQMVDGAVDKLGSQVKWVRDAVNEAGQTTSKNDKKDDENQPNAAVVGRSAARSRENYVSAQTQQVTDAVNNAPLTPYNGDVHRQVGTGYYGGYNQSQYSEPGRSNRPGESTLYTSETIRGVEVESGRYADPGKTGLENRTVVRSEFSGNVVDATNLPGITEGALTEPYAGGKQQTPLSKITGEDPYHHPRALSDAARAKGADASRRPAGEGTVHVDVFPENMTDPNGQLQYRDHYNVDANNVPSAIQNKPADISSPPSPSTPSNYLNPPDGSTEALKNQADVTNHTRAGGARYGAAGGFAVSSYQALRDGELTTGDAANVAIGTGAGAGAAVIDDALTRSMGGSFTAGVKAGGIVDGVVSAGTSVYSNAQAYERGEISAADATADVIVDTGVGVTSGLAGAAAGAAIGSVIPVAGTAVGAVIGFGVGMIASWGASKAIEASGAADWAREGLGDVLEDNKEGMLEEGWSTISSWLD
jgi:hypothetical protein